MNNDHSGEFFTDIDGGGFECSLLDRPGNTVARFAKGVVTGRLSLVPNVTGTCVQAVDVNECCEGDFKDRSRLVMRGALDVSSSILAAPLAKPVNSNSLTLKPDGKPSESKVTAFNLLMLNAVPTV